MGRHKTQAPSLAPFPPPPDIEGEGANPHHPIRFESTGAGREVVLLGTIRIGEVLPAVGGKLLRATVLFRLPDAPRTMFGCTSFEAARSRCAYLTREWIEAAGLKS